MRGQTKISLNFDTELSDTTRERIIEKIENALKDEIIFKERCIIGVI